MIDPDRCSSTDGQHVLHAEEDAQLVDADHVVPALDRLVRNLCEADDPGVVHEHVDPAPALDGHGDRVLPLGRFAHVERLEARVAACGLDLLDDRPARLGRDVEAEHRRAFPGEQPRVRRALSQRGAGDERDLPLDATRHRQAATSERSSARLGARRARWSSMSIRLSRPSTVRQSSLPSAAATRAGTSRSSGATPSPG
jgi:hypothetical protein